MAISDISENFDGVKISSVLLKDLKLVLFSNLIDLNCEQCYHSKVQTKVFSKNIKEFIWNGSIVARNWWDIKF